MKNNRTDLSRLYHAALQKYLKQGNGLSTEPARELGQHAMTMGLETLDMARIHEIALISLVLPAYSSGTRDGMMGRAGTFFAEAITPMEETHRGALEANVHLSHIIESLNQRTLELADSVEGLKQEIIQRKVVEESLKISQQTTSELLKKSCLMQEEMRHLSRRLLTVQEEERKRISRELHDVIAQTLTGINVRLANLKSQSTATSKDIHRKIASTQRLVEKSVDIVHRFARDLRPTVLDDLGLVPALHTYLKDFMERAGIRVELIAYSNVEKLESVKRVVLYRVAQEALANIARHSKASFVKVSIREHDNAVRMEVIDNGKGFQVEGAAFAKSSKRLGLLGMRERVEMIGGTFCVESEPGKGTTIRADIPRSTVKVRKRTPKKSGGATLECL